MHKENEKKSWNHYSLKLERYYIKVCRAIFNTNSKLESMKNQCNSFRHALIDLDAWVYRNSSTRATLSYIVFKSTSYTSESLVADFSAYTTFHVCGNIIKNSLLFASFNNCSWLVLFAWIILIVGITMVNNNYYMIIFYQQPRN